MNTNCSQSNAILGNSIDVNLCDIQDSEIRADVVVKQIRAKRVWGQVVDCDGIPMANALVKLVKVMCHGDTTSYQGVAHTIADCQGFYQFDLCADDKSCYKILVNKSVTGGETVIDTRGGNCNPCAPVNDICGAGGVYNPCCQPGPVTVMPYNQNACQCGNYQPSGCNPAPNCNDGCTTPVYNDGCGSNCGNGGNCKTNYSTYHSY